MMTANDTPSREELLALADEIEQSTGLYCIGVDRHQLGIKKTAQVIAALRLAARPADDGVREEIQKWRNDAFEKSAHIVEQYLGSEGQYIAADIRALSTKAPKP